MEKSEKTFKPDCTLRFDFDINGKLYERTLYVEILVTHAVDENKRVKILSKGISTLEIDISRASRILSMKELWKEMTKQGNLEWVFNAREEQLTKKALFQEERSAKINIDKIKDDEEAKHQFYLKQYDEIKLSKFRLLKIYEGHWIWKDRDNEGKVYCPKIKNTEDTKISINTCEACEFHKGLFPVGLSIQSYPRKVVCRLPR